MSRTIKYTLALELEELVLGNALSVEKRKRCATLSNKKQCTSQVKLQESANIMCASKFASNCSRADKGNKVASELTKHEP